MIYLIASPEKHRADKACNKEPKAGILVPDLLQIDSLHWDKSLPPLWFSVFSSVK